MRTIPSAVLGEYLSDVERFWLFTEPSAFKQDIRPILADSLEHGLAGSLDEWFGPEVTKDYWRTLLYRADKESKARARASYQERRAKWVKVEAAKAERPKLKRQRTDARNNDQKIRAVLLAKRNEAGRVNLGLRKIAKQAGVSEASVRRARDSWERSGQLAVHRYPRGRTSSIELYLEHPAWSERKASHLHSI